MPFRPLKNPSLNSIYPCYQEKFFRAPVGGGGRESNPPATILAAKPVLKTGGATGPLPPPPLFIRYLQRSAQSEARQSAHKLPTIFWFRFLTQDFFEHKIDTVAGRGIAASGHCLV